MEHEQFIELYERALASQNWGNVEPLIAENATVTFSNGNLFKGKIELQGAFEKNFSAIKNEKYAMQNIHWVLKKPTMAVYTFDFNWTGIINGEKMQGVGRGTSVIINQNGIWKLISEHLGPFPKKLKSSI
ncbi:nuclear transport factor 2 family protein [Maribacter sp. 2308TA10-17]|uniref:nuclear transport factor 2 family protein n=1 Tax=Maribacter sp. 2308TA10-17 TaxID=3386276 RepID=UPI0039BCFB6B